MAYSTLPLSSVLSRIVPASTFPLSQCLFLDPSSSHCERSPLSLEVGSSRACGNLLPEEKMDGAVCTQVTGERTEPPAFQNWPRASQRPSPSSSRPQGDMPSGLVPGTGLRATLAQRHDGTLARLRGVQPCSLPGAPAGLGARADRRDPKADTAKLPRSASRNLPITQEEMHARVFRSHLSLI